MAKKAENKGSGFSEDASKAIFGDMGDETAEIYVNAFSLAHGNADVTLKFQRNAKTVLFLNMSFTLAKTLAQLLGGQIQSLESTADIEIQTTADFDKAFSNITDGKK